jgi:hypothetical protein
VLLRDDAFGKAAAMSVALGDVARHALFELLEGPKREASVYVDRGPLGRARLRSRLRLRGRES